MMGWDVDFLQSAIDECTNESGEMSDCALFTIQDDATQGECTVSSIPTDLEAETESLLSALPGNVAIEWGPEAATGTATGTVATTSTSSTYTAPTLTYTPRASTGGIFIEAVSSTAEASSASVQLNAQPQLATVASSSSTTSTSTSTQAPATTPAPTTSIDDATYMVVSTEYRTTGALVEEIIWEEAVVYVTEDTVTTVTVEARALKERRRVSGEHLLRHRHAHGHHY